MEQNPFFSMIIPTYNSERTIELTLQSIRKQTIPLKELEILVIDGGSTDRTLAIAERYGATVLHNPHKLPEYAKKIGIEAARGKYMVRMDSDEEFTYERQLEDKMRFLQRHPELKMLLANQYSKGRRELCGISGEYMNLLGDPFSYFVYNTKKDKIKTYQDNIIITEKDGVIMRFAPGDIYPLADSGTSVLSIPYIKEKYPDEYDTIAFACNAYDRVLRDTELCGCLPKDIIRHNCRSSFRMYLSKLRFRVINNLFQKAESGYSTKEILSKKLKQRKYLFCLYALLVPLPILDSIRLAVIYRSPSFLLHFVYLYYVCLMILIFGIVRVFGVDMRNEGYGLDGKN